MVKQRRGAHVTGKVGALKIQPWITHPAGCTCEKSLKLPLELRAKPHDIRIKRASQYPSDYGKSVQHAFDVKREEEAALTSNVSGEGWMLADVDSITVAQLCAAYLEAHPGNAREEQIIRLHVNRIIGAVVVGKMKAADGRFYQRRRLEEGASPDTVDREWTAVVSALNFGDSEERIARNPIRRGAVERVGESRPREDFFEPEEWRQFIAAFADYDAFREHLARERAASPVRMVAGRSYGSGKRHPDSDASRVQFERLRELEPFVHDLLYSCARIGELAALRRRHVDLRRGLATLHQEKTGKPKTIPIAAPWRERLEAMPRGFPDDLVYTRPSTGEPIDNTEAWRTFLLVLKVADIRKHLTPHSVRHTVLSWLATAGVSKAHRDEIAGHARKTVGDGYAHLTRGSLAPVLGILVRIERDGFTADERGEEITDAAALKTALKTSPGDDSIERVVDLARGTTPSPTRER